MYCPTEIGRKPYASGFAFPITARHSGQSARKHSKKLPVCPRARWCERATILNRCTLTANSGAGSNLGALTWHSPRHPGLHSGGRGLRSLVAPHVRQVSPYAGRFERVGVRTHRLHLDVRSGTSVISMRIIRFPFNGVAGKPSPPQSQDWP